MSAITICNTALALLSVDPIVSFDDGTTQSNLCSRLYEPKRDEVLQRTAWTFNTDRKTILSDATPPDWGYSQRFLLPNKSIRVLEVYKNPPQPGQEHVAPRFRWNVEGKYILADADKIYVQYLLVVTDTSLMSPLFRTTLSYRLASEMALALTENRALMVDMTTLYEASFKESSGVDGAQGSRREKFIGNYVLER